MRKKVLWLVCLFFAIVVQAYAQTAKISIDMKNISIENILNVIEKNSEYHFLYDTKEIDINRKVNISAKDLPVSSVLEKIFSGTGISWKLDNKHIILVPAKKKNESKVEKRITGVVTDSQGEPVIGASIVAKGTGTGTITDVSGQFNLNASQNTLLTVSYIGYETQEVKVGDQMNLNIVLRESAKNLDELVVVGYGVQKKINLSGAVAVVTSEQLKDRPAANMSQLLQGAVPNMNVTFSSGRPGASGDFNIRGVNSIGTTTSGSKPLVLIDGIEGNIDRINPRDVESISVLKDASASAVYGARAAYGVILVTTKTGSNKGATVSYSGKFGFGTSTVSTDFETRGYYSAKINDQFFSSYSGSNYTKYTEEDYQQLLDRVNDKTENPARPWVVVDQRDGRDTYVYYANTDWYNTLFDNTRPTWEHSVSINGGTDKVKYLFSGKMYKQEGVLKIQPDNYKSYNFRSKITAEVKPWLTFTNNITLFRSDYDYPGQGGINSIFNASAVHALASYLPVNPDGTPVYQTSLSNYNIMDGVSAIMLNNKHKNLDKVDETTTTFEADLKLAKGFNVKANYSFVRSSTNYMNRSVNVPYSKYPGEILYLTSGSSIDQLKESSKSSWYQTANIYATYEKKIGSDHNLKVMIGSNYETQYYKDLSASRNGVLTEELNDLNLAVDSVMTITGGQNRYKILGTFYRVNYEYKDRYIFETSGRRDGSSRFAEGHRFGFFPSASAAWRISEEPFFGKLKENVDNLKLRLTYGQLGNQQSGFYDYMQTINTDGTLSYTFGDGLKAGYAYESNPNSSDLTWEVAATSNAGLDIGLFKNRLNLSADFYVRNVSNILGPGPSLPASYGASEPQQNLAAIQTKGYELSLSWNDRFNIASKPFGYSISLGFGDNISHVTKFDNPTKELSSYYVGQQLGEIWGYVVDGYFKTDDEAANYAVDQSAVNTIINSSAKDPGLHAGDMKFVDLPDKNGNYDQKISRGSNTATDPGDRRVIGNSLPRYTYGINIGADWNGIDFSVFFQGVGRQNWYPARQALLFWGPYAQPYSTFIPSDFMDKVWSEDNPDAYFPRARGYIAYSNNQDRALAAVNTKYLQDLAYCRLKSLTIGYTLPQKLMNNIKVSTCRFYFSGGNLLTFTKLESDYIDPEQAGASNNISTSSSSAKIYPWQITYSFGLDITF